MEIYLVGGAVRDMLLQRTITEQDYVVVGATNQQMLDLGFKPVGKDFPVYLHPETQEEYALARTEKKVGSGYLGFSCDTNQNITLEEDLKRRDLTINAMALDNNNNIIDPYGGQQDLANKKLKHVSSAFSEDPVRILRIARFAARYAYLGFSIDDTTLILLKNMVKNGEASNLVAERIWGELTKALGEQDPQVFFEVLTLIDATKDLFSEIHELFNENNIQATSNKLKSMTTLTNNKTIIFASLLTDIDDVNKITKLSSRLKIPKKYTALAVAANSLLPIIKTSSSLNAEEIITLFEKLKVFRDKQLFLDLLTIYNFIYDETQSQIFLNNILEKIENISTQEIIQEGFEGAAIKQELHKKRIKIINELINRENNVH